MNEYERKVNEAAIRASQVGDLKELPYKLPGIKKAGEEKQERYIDKF